MDKCKLQNDVKNFTNHHAYRKILKYKLSRVVDYGKKVPPNLTPAEHTASPHFSRLCMLPVRII